MTIKRRARSRLKKNLFGQTNSLSFEIGNQIRITQTNKRRSSAPKSHQQRTRWLKLIINGLKHELKHWPLIHWRYLIFSLLAWFVFLIFLHQIAPSSVANIPVYRAYLPFHLLLFSADFTLLAAFFSLENSLLLSFIIELGLSFRLQGFVINWWMILTLIFIGLLLRFVLFILDKLDFNRKPKVGKQRRKIRRAKLRRHQRIIN